MRKFLAIVLVFFLAPIVVGASTTVGPLDAGTAQSGTIGSCSDNMNWSVSTSDLSSNDSSFVSYTGSAWDSGNTTDIVEASNFGFNISGTVLGIKVELLGWTTAGGGTYNTMQLMTSPGATPTLVGSNKATGSLPTSDPGSTYQSFGSASDTWTAGLTGSDVSSSGFGVGACWTATSNNSHADIDHVRITITYDASPTLSISQPDGVSDTVAPGDPYNITYTLGDIDSTVTAAFSYDTDNTGLNGTAISGACATAAEGTNVTCSWDTTGMTPGTYYIYGVTNDGVNGDVSAYSAGQITISSPVSIPTLTTDAESGVGNTSATMNGTISDTGGETGAGTDYGFAWGTDSTLSAGDTSTTSLGNYSGTGTFSQAVTNLLSDTTYYYRAYATNSAGTGYGSTIEPFTTGVDTTPSRTLRLFEGYVLKLMQGSRLILYQQ